VIILKEKHCQGSSNKNDKLRVKKYLYHNSKFMAGKQIKNGVEIFVKNT